MTTFSKFFVSIDDYGEPVGVSYKGEGSYKTALGALLTLGMRVLMLLFTGIGLIGLANFEDPQIT